jgi:hypothetical protein
MAKKLNFRVKRLRLRGASHRPKPKAEANAVIAFINPQMLCLALK